MLSTDPSTQMPSVCTNATHSELLARGTYRCDLCSRVFEEPPGRCKHGVTFCRHDHGGPKALYCSLCVSIVEPDRGKRVRISKNRDWLFSAKEEAELDEPEQDTESFSPRSALTRALS